MTSQNKNNNGGGGAKRPALRDVQTRAALDSGQSAVQRPAIAATQSGTPSGGRMANSNTNRPGVRQQDADTQSATPSSAPVLEGSPQNAGVSEADFTTIKSFIDSLGDPQAGIDADDVGERDGQSATSTSGAPTGVADKQQRKQQSVAENKTVEAPLIPTAGTERDRLGFEQNLASIRLEDTDYRRIGHRNNDDKPLSTIIKGGISL